MGHKELDLQAQTKEELEDQITDFKALLKYVNYLAKHKMGYPVSLLTYLGIVDNTILGIRPHSLANVLLNNVGDPFKDSETSLLEVKKHEREVLSILERYYGLKPGEARGYVTTGGTEGNFAALWWSKRYLINLCMEKLITIDDEIKRETKEMQDITLSLAKVSLADINTRLQKLQKLVDLTTTLNNNKNIAQQLLTPTVFYSKGHTHYSIPKVAEILRLNIRSVEANEDGSINLANFKKEIIFNQSAHPFSPVIVIANIGTTVTGALDDVPGLKKILEELKPKSGFTIHLDGALTGFVMPILKPFGEIENYFDALSVNTLAVSAHKYPGLSQPCGIILAKRTFFEKAFEKSERNIEYVGNIVDVTITGSRSGLNVLMLYNALKTLGLNKNNNLLTRLVKENLENAKYLYDQLVSLYSKADVSYLYHFNVTFPKPSINMAKKYQLMLTGNKATICVLTNVTKLLIDEFIMELNAEKEGKQMAHDQDTIQKIDYKIETLAEEHVKSTIELFVKSFCDSEPVTKHLNIQHADYIPFATEVVQKAVKEGLSKVAVDHQHKVIACCLAEDLADPFIPKLAHYPKLAPVFTLLTKLSRPFLAGKKFAKNKIAHVWIAAVDSDYRGHRLSIETDKACAELLARKGYDFVYAEFTNPLSERIVNQYNLYDKLNQIRYKDFKTERGEANPFADVEGNASSYIIVIRPGIKLSALDHTYRVEEKY